MTGAPPSWLKRGIISSVVALAGCQTAPPAPLRSGLSIEVLEARAHRLTVRAAQPLAWALVEVGPLGRLRLLYADSATGRSALAAETALPVDEQVARNGRLMAPGPIPKWITPCEAEGNEVVVDPQTGLHLYAGPECLRTTAGRVEPVPGPARSGYWLVFGSVLAPTGSAWRRLLRTVRPLSSPTGLASTLASALFGQSTIAYDYVVVPIPTVKPGP